jgi:hypothetical protein
MRDDIQSPHHGRKEALMADLPAGLIALLERPSPCLLATINPDGSPQLTQTWVDTDGTHILINTVQGHRKLKNIERDPRVAVSVRWSQLGDLGEVEVEQSVRHEGQPVHLLAGFRETRRFENADDPVTADGRERLADDAFPAQVGQDALFLLQERAYLVGMGDVPGCEEIHGWCPLRS